MGLMDKLRGELIDIIEWLDDSRDTMVWRFPRYQNEIKMGAKLVVRESQTAVFVNEGKIADVFEPGTYTLETRNLPILSTLKGWKYGFNSPFKAEVYFVNTRQFTDMKWGTQNPVILRDAEFGVVRVRAFGAFAARVVDASRLLRELVAPIRSSAPRRCRNTCGSSWWDAWAARSPRPACRCWTSPRTRTRSAGGWPPC